MPCVEWIVVVVDLYMSGVYPMIAYINITILDSLDLSCII